MKIQPLGDYVLIRQVEAEEMTAGGIYLPDTAREKPAEGLIVAVAADIGEDVAIGDKVIYKRFAGEELKIDGEKLRLVSVGDLLAKYVSGDEID